ncbi:hypothetical protein M3Y96_00479300 [Aphelenchoides besseyi]|nr:hypothetical protein M3Y96_00479300 [Aphelenchoides besseyi]
MDKNGKNLLDKVDDDKLQVETKIVHVDLIVDFVVLYADGGGLLDEGLMPLELGTAQNENNFVLLVFKGHYGCCSGVEIYSLFGILIDGFGPTRLRAACFRPIRNQQEILGAWDFFFQNIESEYFSGFSSSYEDGYSGGPVIRLGVDNDLLGIAVSGSRDGQQLVQIIPAAIFATHIDTVTDEMMLDDAQNDVWPTTE